MDLSMFENDAPGTLVPIHGTDSQLGEWTHSAFLPEPLGADTPTLSPETYLVVLNARAALAALDATARQLPNPTLFRTPALRREAQSTSALEGTYAPLAEVLTADEDAPSTPELLEVLNYVSMANLGFARVAEGQPVSVALLGELHKLLMRGTPMQEGSGRVRDRQVVIGRRAGSDPFGFPVHAARFVPAPASPELEIRVRDLTDWMRLDHTERIDPVIAAAMAHYQFETLHPFHDGNGRIGRYLVVLHLQAQGVLEEPTLTVSPWFEERRPDYYDRLLAVSTRGDWDGFIRFFAQGIRVAADTTRGQMLGLVQVQERLGERLQQSALRARSAHALVDFAVANPSFTVRRAAAGIGLSYGRANTLVSQLVELGILRMLGPESAYQRRFFAPSVLNVLTGVEGG
ncbi:MAG: Fic family protein [Leucobacter sp.]|jgi:Fic family protein